MFYSGDSSDEASEKRLNDSAVAELAKLDHVTSVSPEYDMSVLLLKGGYEGWAELVAMKPEDLKALKLDLKEGGRLPKSNMLSPLAIPVTLIVFIPPAFSISCSMAC